MKTKFSERDEFNRVSIAENLYKIINSEIDISPVILDAPWGAGKTEFCHKTINLFNEKPEAIKTLYLDAFMYDHTDDPLLMLLTGISSTLEENSSQKNDLFQMSVPVAKTLSKFIGKAGISWVLKQSADEMGKELSEAIESNSGELVELGIKKAFKDFERLEENLVLLKSTLAKISVETPLVIFIDELDRCRPNFALSLIEKVKHIFDIPNITFIFSTNFQQLTAIVKREYGAEVDAISYLRKFFNYEIKLSSKQRNGRLEYKQGSMRLMTSLLLNDSKMLPVYGQATSIDKFLSDIFTLHDRSLRDAEKFYRNIQIYNEIQGAHYLGRYDWGQALMRLIGVYIYTFYPILTDKILYNQYDISEIETFFGASVEEINSSPYNGTRLPLTHVISAIFIESSTVKTGLTSPFDEAIQGGLNDCIKGLFSHGYDPGPDERTGISCDAIQIMQLLN